MPKRPGLHKRRAKLIDSIEWLTEVFVHKGPGSEDAQLLVDSTPGGTPTALRLTNPRIAEREFGLEMLCATLRGGETVFSDKD